MPRCAKKTSLTLWMDRKYRELDPGLASISLVIDAPRWVVDLLKQEGCKSYYTDLQVRLPCGKTVRGGWLDGEYGEHSCIVYVRGAPCPQWDLSRFWPRATQAALSKMKEFAQQTSYITLDSLPSTVGESLGASDQALRPRRPAGRTIVQRFTGGRFGNGVFQWRPRRQGRT